MSHCETENCMFCLLGSQEQINCDSMQGFLRQTTKIQEVRFRELPKITLNPPRHSSLLHGKHGSQIFEPKVSISISFQLVQPANKFLSFSERKRLYVLCWNSHVLLRDVDFEVIKLCAASSKLICRGFKLHGHPSKSFHESFGKFRCIYLPLLSCSQLCRITL